MYFKFFITALTLFSLQAFANSAAAPIEVLQATAVFGRAKDLRYLQAGVSTCVVVAVFEPKSRNIYFAHVDAGTDVQTAMLSAIEKFKAQGVEPKKLRAYIAGGWKGWSDTQSEQARITLKQAGVRIVAYEPPVDIGYTIEDDRNLVVPPKRARGIAVRSYRFDMKTERLSKVTEPQKQFGLPASTEHLVVEQLPLSVISKDFDSGSQSSTDLAAPASR